jgi:hypothetical protein
MKKQIFTLITLAFATTLSAQIPNYVPTNGLVGWWPFNGNANDESGNGNNGTVNGATLTTDRFGVANNCYNFNVNNWTWGANGDYIYIPYNSMLNFTEFTVSTWVNRNSDGATISPQGLSIIRRYEYGYNSPSGETWTLDIAHGTNPTGAIVSAAVLEQSSPATNVNCSTTETIPMNQWSFVTMSYEQSTLKIYINAALVCSQTDPSILINTTGNSGISIGLSTQANGHWAPFDGKIDDIGIWNRALTACEIQDLYNAQLGSSTTSSTQTQTALDSYTWPVNGQTYTQSGLYYDTLTNAAGCDSVITLDLTLSFTGIEQIQLNASKKLAKITDLNGKETPFKKNTVLLFVYEDGTVERIYEAE